MAAALEHGVFAPLVNTKFRVLFDAADPLEIELTQISELLLTARQEQFTLVFRGANEAFLGQGSRRISHDQMGEFDLFLVPISQDASGTCYEAVFNRFRKAD